MGTVFALFLFVFLTPSRLKSARRCLRRWWFDLKKTPKQRMPWQDRGDELHRQGEHYSVYGVLPPSPAVQALLPYLDPPPHPKALVECTMPGKAEQRRQQFQVRADHVSATAWQGQAIPLGTDLKFRSSWEDGYREAARASEYLDALATGATAPEPPQPGDKEWLEKWKRDEQALMTGWAVSKGWAFAFRWLTAKLKLPKGGVAQSGPRYENVGAVVRPLIVRYEPGEVGDLLADSARPLVAEMAKYEYAATPQQVPPTGLEKRPEAACLDYGGCAFRAHCKAIGTPVPDRPPAQGAAGSGQVTPTTSWWTQL